MKNNKVKTYGLLAAGAALITTGMFGLNKTDMIAYKINKHRNVVAIVSAVLAFIGISIAAYILDGELYPEDDEFEEAETTTEN